MAPKNELSRRQRGHHESGQICLSRPPRQKAIISQSLDCPPQQCSARARTHLCSVHRYRKKEEYRTRPKSALRTRRTTPRYLQDIRRFRQIGEISQKLCLATSKRLHRKTPEFRVFFLYLSSSLFQFTRITFASSPSDVANVGAFPTKKPEQEKFRKHR